MTGMLVPPQPQPVKPAVEGGRHVLAWDDVRLEIDAAHGRAGHGAAPRRPQPADASPPPTPGNYGSTFWPSPQTAWGWPPVAEIDHGPYRVEVEPAAIVMRSAVSPALGVSVDKRFCCRRRRAAR